MAFRFSYLLLLVIDPRVFPHLRDLILDGSEKILSFRWNGPQVLDVILRYAIRLCLNSKHGSVRDMLEHLENLAADKDCYIMSPREHCREFLELLFSFTRELREIFAVPMLQHLSDCDNTLKKNELVASFVYFLVETLEELLDSETDSMDQVKVLLMELKFLLTFLGDTPLQCSAELDETKNILTEIEDIANDAGIVLYSFLFTTHPVDLGLSILLPKFEILKAKIKELPRCSTQNTALVSLFIVDSLLDDLDRLLNNQADLTVDMKDLIGTFHKELQISRSLLHDKEVQKHSKTKKMKECVTQLSNLAYEAEYIINSFVVGEVHNWYLSLRLSDFIQMNKLIKTAISEMKLNYGIESLEVSGSPSLVSFQPKIISPVEDIIVGIEEERTKIASQLVGGPNYRQIICISGMPGLGKTTLAKKLYNDSSVLYHFHKRSWCVVSQTYQKKNLLIQILSSISNLNQDIIVNMDDEMLAENLYKTLKGRRYLMVMDDVWDINAWNDFKSYFPDDKNGSRILFTSRIKDVALQVSSHGIVNELPFLPVKECWCLIKNKVFQKELCPPELQEIGMEISRKCQGLPLAAVVIASVLANMERKESLWQDVATSLSSYFFGDPSKDIIELSYKHLPIHLKPCFLYFGAFPEDMAIPVRKLLSLWIAEGFIQKKEQKRLEDVAEEYLLDLINRSLVQVAKRRSDGGVKACNIHDLIHDMCLIIAKKENFLKVAEKILDSETEFIPMGIKFMVHLRYLRIKHLSSSTIAPENLEFLLAESADVIPPFLLDIPKLRHLHVRDPVRFSENCNRSQINNFETLSFICIFDLKDEEILRCSPNLRSLKCIFQPLSVDEKAYRNPDFNFLTQLESLKMVFQRNLKVECTVINFPVSIRKLTLDSTGFPWEKISLIGTLPNLEILKLEYDSFKGEIWDTKDDEFQKLKFLKVDGLELEQWNASSDHFPRLERLVLRKCYKLSKIPFELGHIPTLQMIEVHFCGISIGESAMLIKEEQQEYGNEELKIIISGSFS